MVTYLEGRGAVVEKVGQQITATVDSVNYVSNYNSDGILTSLRADLGGTVGQISMVLQGGDEPISLVYALFLIIPVAVIAVIIRKRKTVKLT